MRKQMTAVKVNQRARLTRMISAGRVQSTREKSKQKEKLHQHTWHLSRVRSPGNIQLSRSCSLCTKSQSEKVIGTIKLKGIGGGGDEKEILYLAVNKRSEALQCLYHCFRTRIGVHTHTGTPEVHLPGLFLRTEDTEAGEHRNRGTCETEKAAGIFLCCP